MKQDDQELELFDMYTKNQLVEIAEHNNVQIRKADKKLNLARAIIAQTNGMYDVPKTLTPAKLVGESKVKSLNHKERKEFLETKADLIDDQWKNTLTEEEFKERPLANTKRRSNNNTPADPEEKIAVYSNRNISWDGIGKLSKGYTFMKREEANVWKRLRGVRDATPEEVASHFDLQ